MTCREELVSAYVDGELDLTFRADVDAHLAVCAACAEQARAERALHRSLRGLPVPDLPAGLEGRIRERVRPRPARAWRVLLPLAAALLVSLAWARGNPTVLSAQLAFDHRNCFGKERLPAKVWGQDPRHVVAWFEAQGVTLPRVPEEANGLTLIGGRFCPLLDRKVAHLYYGNGERHASLYLVPGPVRFSAREVKQIGARTVQVLRTAQGPLAIVAEDRADGAALRKAFESTMAGTPAPEAAGGAMLTLLPSPVNLFVLHPVGL